MSTSYMSADSGVQALQLKVQSLCVKLSDNQIASAVGSTVVIDVGQPLLEVRVALFLDDSAATCLPVVAANRVVAGSTVTLTLSAPMVAADAILIDYVINDSV